MSNSTLISTTCYWPNGWVNTDFEPCDPGPDERHATCCNLKDSVCTKNGYCIGSSNYAYRGACTDSTWQTSSCPVNCRKENAANFVNILDCGHGTSNRAGAQSWCCDEGPGTECCGNSSTMFPIMIGQPYYPNRLLVSNTATGSNSTVKTSTECHSRQIAIGAGVGIGVGALILASMAWFIFSGRKKKVVVEKEMAHTHETPNIGSSSNGDRIMSEEKRQQVLYSPHSPGRVEVHG